jgi:hypothetical protein
MTSTKIIFEDSEKIVHEVLGDPQEIPDWIFFGGTQLGKCLLEVDADGNYKKSTMYHGIRLDIPENKAFVIKVKHPVVLNEAYSFQFEPNKTNVLSCYDKERWEIPLSKITNRFPNLNQVTELKEHGKKYAVPGLIFDTAKLDDQFEMHKDAVVQLVLEQLQDYKVFGYLERESTYQWHVGVPDYNNTKFWIAFRMLWNVIKDNVSTLAKDIVQVQDSGSFAHNIESSRIVLTQVIQPLCVAHNITRLAEKHNLAYNLYAQQQWISIELSKLVRKSFVKAFENE